MGQMTQPTVSKHWRKRKKWRTGDLYACYQIMVTIRMKWHHSNLWSQNDLHLVGQHSVPCDVQWWRFVALFK